MLKNSRNTFWRRFWAIPALGLLLLASGPLEARQLSQAQILDGLSRRYRGLDDLQATYSRVASTPSTDQIFKSGSSQVATGVLYWSRPAKLLLDQSTPAPETMVTDGRTVWWHLPGEKIVYRYRNIDVAGQLKPLLSFLGGLDSLQADFQVGPAPFDPARPGQHGLILWPKGGPEGGVEQLTVWCDDSFILTGFRLNSITGESTDFYLTGFRENPGLDQGRFTFRAPRGTEVIEENGD
ncbi:MAG: outer membrane lipoprotein carrier protein LolA [Candidatus Adiutrix sp.]|jgi:outer membrane lipoprotein-sorting protein|nr:outer membrane lipoprotein carrier protein LolA [Candidatus Adiutrix sp.]